jgi:predicted ATPase/DNA-binding CsgD family transcriptional regulator
VKAAIRPGNLPAELAPLVGRRRELRQLREILVETRLLTLTGVGGVGKSRLALAVARELEHQNRNGTWLVELASIRDPRLVASALARAIGAEKKPREPSSTSIARLLVGAPALVLLDNCEHVLDAAAELSLELLERCAQLRVLATSRQPLGLEGEATFTVPPLATPKGDLDVTAARQALNFGAIEMFTARATAADPGFSLTDTNVAKVVDICRRLGGIPLGLELAAVRVRTLSLGDLRQRLDDQLTLANPSGHPAQNRHRTMAATLDWSHELLSGAEQVLLRRLAVFGGFTAEAAEQVCADPALPRNAILETLSGLTEKSLVTLDRDRDAERYRLLEPVRLYALDHLRRSGEETALKQAHLSWCLDWTSALEGFTVGATSAQMQQIGDEAGNLLVALHSALDEASLSAYGLQLIDQIGRAWLISNWARELAYYGDHLLNTGAGGTQAKARVLYATGRAAWRLGDHVDANRRFHACLALAGQENGHDIELGLARLGLGFAAVWEGQTAEAAVHLGHSIRLLDPETATVMRVEATLWLACSRMQDNPDFGEARRLIEQALELNARTRDASNQGLAHWLLGEIDLREGDYGAAETNFVVSLTERNEVGHRVGVAYALQGLAFTARVAGRKTRAAELMGAADALSESLGHALLQLPGTDRHEWEAEVRSYLGEKRFRDHYGAGRARREADALSLALGHDVIEWPTAEEAKAILTRREAEVARLVATGASNRKIANKLSISDQTVKFHVHNILNKLSVETRTEIAAWHARQAS